MRIKNMETWGFEHAVRGMRNPLNSWRMSDSYRDIKNGGDFVIGPNDLDLMKRLYKGGTEQRKFMRQIFVSMDIEAPLYWWKQFDTYKVGVTTDSCSTMHTVHKKKFEESDFEISFEDKTNPVAECFKVILDTLNELRDQFLKTEDKKVWEFMIKILPSSFKQKRTVTMSYENAANMIKQRSNHKLGEWHYFCKNLRELPYMQEISNA